MLRIKKTCCLLAVLLAVCSPAAWGQILYGQPTAGSIQFSYTDWSIESSSGKTTISQLTIPVNGFIPLQNDFEALFYVASSSNDLVERGTEYSLAGMSDFRLMLNRSFMDDHLVTSLGVNLPLGKKKLDLSKEWIIIDYLSDNYLSFPVRRFGEGLGLSLLFGGAGSAGEMRYGAGVMYQYNGTYEPYEGYDDYNPGDLVSFNLGAEIHSDEFTLGSDLIISLYTADRSGDTRVYKQGDQVDFRLAGSHGTELFAATAAVRYLWRGAQTGYDTDTDKEIESLKSYGNEFVVTGMVSWSLMSDWSFAPAAELKLISANEMGFDNSSVFGFGAGIGRKLGERVNFDVGARLYTGNADGGNVDLSGFQITGGLTGTF
ncbi:MAG: hypothetical protein JSV44_00875 [Candidatus Zixiibacteriota bacterium]|nr:MAG: hypothetical protein JSV44_00875 [candidate division Zixibacteria bacterium]